VGALGSIWEGVEPVGSTGGHQRDLYADFLDEAALPADVPEYARLRELTADVAAGVAAGDDGAEVRSSASAQLWALRAEYDRKRPIRTGLRRTGGAGRRGL
jgi:hypothetical protein